MADNKSIVQRLIDEVWNGKNREAIGEIYSEEIVVHSSDGEMQGIDGYRELFDRYMTAFPDSEITVEGMVSEGDSVATAYSFSGTHEGDLMGTAPTGRQVTVKGTAIARIADGKIVEERTIWDTGSMMQQLGLIPEPD